MPLIAKASIILLVTIVAMLVSPLTLAAGTWIAGPGAPLGGLAIIAASAAIAFRTAVAIHALR